jgi:hypothetical protein
MNINTLIKLSRRQPFPPCKYCVKGCKDEDTS